MGYRKPNWLVIKPPVEWVGEGECWADAAVVQFHTNQTAASGAAKVLNSVAGNESIMVMQHNDSLSHLGAAVLELIQGSIAKGHFSATL